MSLRKSGNLSVSSINLAPALALALSLLLPILCQAQSSSEPSYTPPPLVASLRNRFSQGVGPASSQLQFNRAFSCSSISLDRGSTAPNSPPVQIDFTFVSKSGLIQSVGIDSMNAQSFYFFSGAGSLDGMVGLTDTSPAVSMRAASNGDLIIEYLDDLTLAQHGKYPVAISHPDRSASGYLWCAGSSTHAPISMSVADLSALFSNGRIAINTLSDSSWACTDFPSSGQSTLSGQAFGYANDGITFGKAYCTITGSNSKCSGKNNSIQTDQGTVLTYEENQSMISSEYESEYVFIHDAFRMNAGKLIRKIDTKTTSLAPVQADITEYWVCTKKK